MEQVFGFVFFSGILICVATFGTPDETTLSLAKDVFVTALPVATGIVTYWFASRRLRSGDGIDHQEVRETSQGQDDCVPDQLAQRTTHG